MLLCIREKSPLIVVVEQQCGAVVGPDRQVRIETATICILVGGVVTEHPNVYAVAGIGRQCEPPPIRYLLVLDITAVSVLADDVIGF